MLLFLWLGVVLEGGPYLHTDVIHQVFAGIAFARIDFNFFQAAVGIEWYGGVEKQVVIVDGVHTTVAQQQRSEEHTSELQSRQYLVCRLLLEKKTTKSFTFA